MNEIFLVLLLTIKYSHYWPPAGGTNCSAFVEGQCISRMASGYRWQDWIDKACACPPEWPFGTIVELDGEEWVCMDRGGGIRFDSEGVTYVDFLAPHGQYSYRELVEVKVSSPGLQATGREPTLLEPEVLALDNLSTGEVNRPDCEYEIHPHLEGRGEFLIAELCQDDVEPNANTDAEDDSGVAFYSRYRDREVVLYEALDFVKPSGHEGPF